MYHRIGVPGDPLPHLAVSQFRRQLEWLAANCEVIAPDSLEQAVHSRNPRRPPVLVTFDDGNRDYYELAYPVLKEFGMPAVVFLITDYVDRPRLLWWDHLHLAVNHARVDRVTLPWQRDRSMALGGADNDRVISECEHYLKSVADDEKERAFDELLGALGDPAIPDLGRQTMNWEEVRATMDLTTYGGHTHRHPLMSKIDSGRLECEIRLCRERIVAETGVQPRLFAYPNGDFTPRAKTLLQQYGFDVAFSTVEGLNDGTTDRMAMRRTAVANLMPTRRMMVKSWI
jgi:peptidoglycan/xylan/chitin deacetylase (PgdA/CDA1 family)